MINCNMRIQVDGGGKSSDYKWMGVEKVINCKLATVFIYTQHAKLAETCMHAAAGPGTSIVRACGHFGSALVRVLTKTPWVM